MSGGRRESLPRPTSVAWARPATMAGRKRKWGRCSTTSSRCRFPQHVGRTVTIGVQRVAEGGLQSDFTTVAFVIPPLVS